jgi:hypothetical protein
MSPFIRVLVLGLLIASRAASAQSVPDAVPAAPAVQATPPAAPPVSLTPEQMEVFLTKARIVSIRSVSTGVTDSRRATLSDGTITHDVHVQVVDQAMPVFQAGKQTELNFKDSYRFNIAGYHVARLIGLDNVPMSVERRVDTKTAAVTWWVDDVQMDEKERMRIKSPGVDPDRTSKQVQVMRIFDELIQNRDRNQGNILWTKDGKMWLIDHTRAFRLGGDLIKPEQLTRCERSLLDHLRRLTADAIMTATKGSLTKSEASALLKRRDAIVKHYDALIARRGEAAVLFTL